MNKAVTEGIQFMPPPFIEGLSVWSRGDGTPGTDTYDGASDAAFVADDADFNGCLELTKTESTQRLRYMGQTPILPGCYVRVRVRLKVLSGIIPSVRIAGWAGQSNGSHLNGVAEYGPTYRPPRLNDIFTIEAYIGMGARSGVDMPWGNQAAYGHFGIDLLGDNGAVLRIDDIEITDGTEVFLRDMLDVVDIRDYGAFGDGFSDDTAALEAADQDADGRTILVPDGIFRINSSVSIASPIRFVGTLSMPKEAMLLLLKNYDLPTYISAFGDEETALRKALQALFNSVDHESLDMRGRRVQLSGPVDVADAVDNKSSYSNRRVIRNGQLEATDSIDWTSFTIAVQARYDAARPLELSSVQSVASIPVGSRISGTGVGREVYVKSRNIGAETLELSAALYGGSGTRTYTFTRDRYILDFSGFSALYGFVIDSVEFKCNGRASAIMLAPDGHTFHLRDSRIYEPRDRGITSIGQGCQDLMLDRNDFRSNEFDVLVQNRTSILFNANANDLKIRNNRPRGFVISASSAVTGIFLSETTGLRVTVRRMARAARVSCSPQAMSNR